MLAGKDNKNAGYGRESPEVTKESSRNGIAIRGKVKSIEWT
jgi:hypothetical protein